MRYGGTKNVDLLQPLRAKDKPKTDKKSPRPSANKSLTPGLSPIKSAAKVQLISAGDRSRLADTPSRVMPGRVAAREPEKSSPIKNRIIEAEELPEEKLDSSFEIEEKRIKKENALRDLVSLVLKIAEEKEATDHRVTFEILRKFSKIYEVQMEYAKELRESFLKKAFFTNFQEAAKKHNFRRKLVRNFARVLFRPLKVNADLVLKQGFSKIKGLKVPLCRPTREKKSPKPTHNRNSTEVSHQSLVKNSTFISDTCSGLNHSDQNITKSDILNKPKPKPKIEPERTTPLKTVKGKDRATTPLRGNEVSKEKNPLKKQTEIQPMKSREPQFKKQAGMAVKHYSVNSSVDDIALSGSKLRQSTSVVSTARNMKKATVAAEIDSKTRDQGVAELKTESVSKRASCPEEPDSILNKHKEYKEKLLRQIRGGDSEEDEEDTNPMMTRPQQHVIEKPSFHDSSKNFGSNL